MPRLWRRLTAARAPHDECPDPLHAYWLPDCNDVPISSSYPDVLHGGPARQRNEAGGRRQLMSSAAFAACDDTTSQYSLRPTRTIASDVSMCNSFPSARAHSRTTCPRVFAALFCLLTACGLVTAQNSTNSTSPAVATANATSPSSNATELCSCGFLDPTTNRVYTDSIIVYFNETNSSIPNNTFAVDTFEHPYERGWDIYYREGAITENVYFTQGSVWNLQPRWLTLNVSAATPSHLVNGAQLQTIRQDIQYGTFRVFMRSPAPYAGGTALSMKLRYNETSSAQLDLLNQDDSQDDACMQALVGGQGPSISTGINYTVLETAPYNIGPWDFWQWRMDWSADTIDWYAGAFKTHSNSTSNANLQDVPTAFFLKHWSTGEASWMQGPPTNNSNAAIGWVRLFFNSSLPLVGPGVNASTCTIASLCSTEDWTLRITTNFTAAATERWIRPVSHRSLGSIAAGVALLIISGLFSLLLVLNAWMSRARSRRIAGDTLNGQKYIRLSPPRLGTTTGSPQYQDNSKHVSVNQPAFTDFLADFPPLSEKWDARASTTSADDDFMVSEAATVTSDMRSDMIKIVPSMRGQGVVTDNDQKALLSATSDEIVQEGSSAAANPGAKPVTHPAMVPNARMRVDYLAGLVAICSLLVSCTHFILTFTPSVIMEYLPRHNESEYWARRTIEPFTFNEVWVGLFFTTSTRFLTTSYLRNGNLKVIAEKIVCRTPRLMIPITAVILLEYFLMDLGAITYLEYIPSITWTTWVSAAVFPNFGWFINNTIQLFYLIPNAAPQVTWNYCMGVLWTIPVQLQNSWLVLLGVVIIRDIKTPWKRFGYYAFCIVNHWYGLSWGSYFWFGLMLADLDITYKYRKFIHARWYVHYPMLCLAVALVLLSLGNDLVAVWTGFSFSTQERGIHPEFQSARPLAQTSLAGYPLYIEPKLNGLVFVVASQYIVELSTWTQALLSTRVFLWLFPHVFTIYLVHGLVFWSIGSLVCVYFAGIGLAYSINILLTAIICYATLFLSLPIITPAMEMLGKEVTKSIWVGASQEPPPRQPTSFPFTVDDVRRVIHRKDDE